MKERGPRRGGPRSAWVLALALAVWSATGARDARAYGEQGYYTGAYALVGEGGCTGTAMGVNPFGGCTPGVDALIRSEAFAIGVQGADNYSEAIADLSLASLKARSIFPDGAGNTPAGVANLSETFTAVGDLPEDVTVTVAMRLGSIVTGGASGSGYGTLYARLAVNGAPLGSGTSYFFRDPTCVIAGGEPCSTASGWVGYDVIRTVTVNDANRSFRVDAVLEANGGGNPGRHSSDGWAKVWVLAPAVLHFTSASGVFRTVPEPSQGGLALGSIATLGAASGRERRRRAALRAR